MMTVAERRIRLKEIYNGFTLPEVSDEEQEERAPRLLRRYRHIERSRQKDGHTFHKCFGATTRSGRGLSTDDVRAIVDDFETAPRGSNGRNAADRHIPRLKHWCAKAIARKWHISEKRARNFWYAHLEAIRPAPAVIYASALPWPDFDCLPIGQVMA